MAQYSIKKVNKKKPANITTSWEIKNIKNIKNMFSPKLWRTNEN